MMGRTLPFIVPRESAAVPMIRQNVASGTTVHADESGAWDILHASYPMLRVNHSREFKSDDGACTNDAESWFSRLRRAEYGVFHRISGRYLQAYSDEMAWREDHRREPNGLHFRRVTGAALRHPKSGNPAGLLATGHRLMAEAHVISALTERRARLAGELRAKQADIRQMKAAIASIDLCIRMFKADYEPESIAPKVTFGKNPAVLPKGSGSRRALDILRETGEAFTAPELARLILERMERERSEQAISMLAKTIHSSFKRQKNPVVIYDRASTWPGKWRLLPP